MFSFTGNWANMGGWGVVGGGGGKLSLIYISVYYSLTFIFHLRTRSVINLMSLTVSQIDKVRKILQTDESLRPKDCSLKYFTRY